MALFYRGKGQGARGKEQGARGKRIVLFAIILLSCVCGWAQKVTYQGGKHYAERVAQFDAEGPLPAGAIVMLGNSLTERAQEAGGWSHLLGQDTIVNRGISGDTAKGIHARLVQILPSKPKAIFLLCGTNDISHKLTAEQVFARCRKVIDEIRAKSPSTRLFVQSLLPFNEGFHRWKLLEGRSSVVPKVNSMLRSYCKQNGITFINLYDKFTWGDSDQLASDLTVDGLHLNSLGYNIWAAQIKPYIEEVNKK